MSETTTSLSQFLPPSASALRGFTLPTRPLKVTVAAAIALLGAYGVLSERQYLSSNDAVVSSYVLDVRTPIAGTLQGAPVTAGDTVQAGALLGRVGDELTDQQHLDDLRLRAEAPAAAARALLQERHALQALQGQFLSRAAVYKQAMGQRLGQDAESARLVLAGKEAALQQANLDAERGRKLADWGVLSKASYDKLLSSQKVLTAEVQAQQSTFGALETERAAINKGILSEPGTNNDVAYSVQRADDVALRLAANQRDLEAAQAQEREANLAVARETARTSLLRQSELRAPSGGLVWKLDAVNGEHVVAGSPVLSLVDCSRQFVLAQVPQERASTILLNSRAEVKLTGESAAQFGTVMTVSSDAQRNLDGKLAATPLHKSMGDVATVVIRLDPKPEGGGAAPCMVGRTARVRLSTAQTNLVMLWLSQQM